MREINYNARLKGVNQKFEPRQSGTFVRGRTKVFKKVGSVRKRFLSPSSPPPYFSFFALALFLARPETGKWLTRSLETLAANPTLHRLFSHPPYHQRDCFLNEQFRALHSLAGFSMQTREGLSMVIN